MKKEVYFVKNDGVTSKKDELPVKYECESKCHLCWDCANARANMCKKIWDRKKSDIDQYNFITDGYQIFKYNDETGEYELDTFFIDGCNNFTPDQNIKLSPVEINNRKKSLFEFYMDAPDFETAYLQYLLGIENGEYEVPGERADRNTINKLSQIVRNRKYQNR